MREQERQLSNQPEPISVNGDRVFLYPSLSAEWALPDGTTIPAMGADPLAIAESDNFRRGGPGRERRPAAEDAAAPKPRPAEFPPAALKRRILQIAPTMAAEA